MNLQDVVSILDGKGCKPHKNGSGWTSLCPAHEDSNPSLSIADSPTGTILLKCHAGCDFKTIVAAMGVNPREFFAPAARSVDTVEATYDYVDKHGTLIFQVLRKSGKKFIQRRPDPAEPGKWIWSTTGILKPLFRLPDVLSAVSAGHTIYVCEGEKDALAMVKAGFHATTAAGGSEAAWTAEYSQALAGADVVLFEDRDPRNPTRPHEPPAGFKHTRKVARALHGIARSVRILQVPDVAGRFCKDPADFLSAGGSRTILFDLALAAPLSDGTESFPGWPFDPAYDTEPEPESTPVVPEIPTDYDPQPLALPDDSDAQRAAVIVERFSSILRYVPEWKRWLVFEAIGSHPPRWHSRDDGALVRCVRTLSAELYGSAVSGGDPTAMDAAVKYADARHIRDATLFCQSDRRVIISPHDVDSDPWVIGAPNGYIDLRTGTLHPHDTSHIITKSVRPDYSPTADCPTWMAWIEQMLPSAPVRLFVQRLAGYSLTGIMSEQIFLFLHGLGANGKSTLIEVLFHIFGSYALKAPDRFVHMDDRGSTPPDVIAAIDGVRFLVGPETTEGARINEGPLKDLTGGDSMTGARKYEHSYTFSPIAKLWLFGNHKPVVRGTDDGFWRRLRLVHFPVQIAATQRDGTLKERLKAEASGILSWAIEGCLDWQRAGLQTPTSIEADTQQYREDEDPLADFISERTCDAIGQSISIAKLYVAYKSWADASGIRNQLTNRSLCNKLRDRGWLQSRSNASRSWTGKMIVCAPTELDG